MAVFGWLSPAPIPVEADLRRLGWGLLAPDAVRQAGLAVPLLCIWPPQDLAGAARTVRAAWLVLDVADSTLRAQLLELGVGDVVAPQTALGELAARAQRVAKALRSVPRERQAGPLRLDLLQRQAWAADRTVGLNPREFALLWRLAEIPGEPLAPDTLLRDVWDLRFRPETNSLAVHVCRLRAKLAAVGCAGLVSTTAGGGYVLRIPATAIPIPNPAPWPANPCSHQ